MKTGMMTMMMITTMIMIVITIHAMIMTMMITKGRRWKILEREERQGLI